MHGGGSPWPSTCKGEAGHMRTKVAPPFIPRVRLGLMNTNADLLKSLKIDRNAPPPSAQGFVDRAWRSSRRYCVTVAAWSWSARAKATEGIGRAGNGVAAATAARPRCWMPPATWWRGAWPRSRPRSPARCARSRLEEGQHGSENEVRCATPDPVDAEQQRALSASAGRQAARSQADARAGAAEGMPRPMPRGCRRWSASSWCRGAARPGFHRQREYAARASSPAQRNAQARRRQLLRIAEQGVDNTIIRGVRRGVVDHRQGRATWRNRLVVLAGGGHTRTGIGTHRRHGCPLEVRKSKSARPTSAGAAGHADRGVLERVSGPARSRAGSRSSPPPTAARPR